jgi:hypothetical protein
MTKQTRYNDRFSFHTDGFAALSYYIALSLVLMTFSMLTGNKSSHTDYHQNLAKWDERQGPRGVF